MVQRRHCFVHSLLLRFGIYFFTRGRELIKAVVIIVLPLILSLNEAIGKSNLPRGCDKESVIEVQSELDMQDLKTKAQKSLRANIVELETGSYVRAGANHFGSLWTRDFVYTIPGLLTLGADGEKAARDHLTKLLNNLREDGLVPRLYDIEGKNGLTGSERRIAAYVLDGRSPFSIGIVKFISFLPFVPFEVEFDLRKDPTAKERRDKELKLSDRPDRPLISEYLGEHGTPAFDSNILTVLGALQYADKSGDMQWFDSQKENILKAYKFYDDKFSKKELIKQPKYSDWQDSVSRKGHTFYVNFLYWKVGTELLKHKGQYRDLLEKYNINTARLSEVKFKLWEKYYSKKKGIFKSHLGHWLRHHYGLEDQLFSIQYPEFYRGVTVAVDDETVLSGEKLRRHHYESLKKSRLWKGSKYNHYDFNVPGLATQGPYFFWDRSYQTTGAGIRRYHDKFIWSWLVGESAKVAAIMDGPEAGKKILTDFANTGVVGNEHIGEIYSIKCDSIVESKTGILGIKPSEKRYFYRSEAPFAWGSAKLLEGIATVESL